MFETHKKHEEHEEEPDLNEILEMIFKTDLKDNIFLKDSILKARRTGDWSHVFSWLKRNQNLVERAMAKAFYDEQVKQNNPFHPLPTQNDFEGSLNLGIINNLGHQFRIDPDDLTMHCMTLGATGAGKSWLMLHAVPQLCPKPNFNVVIPDVKLFYRRLHNFVPGLGILTADKFIFNPLEVPSWINPTEFIFLFSRTFAAENFLGAPSEAVLIDVLNALFERNGIFAGSKNFPTMYDLSNALRLLNQDKQLSFRYHDIFENLIGRVRPYTMLGQCFSKPQGIPVDVFSNQNVVLELPSNFGTNNVTNFIITFIILMTYTKNMLQNNRGKGLQTLFIVDEASTLMQSNRDKQDSFIYEPTLNEIIRKSREFGIGLWLCSQEAESFNYVFKANSMTKIGFPLDGVDHESIAKTFGLNKEQQEFLYKLPNRRVAVAKTRKFERPFLIEVPFIA